jgi:hypothetical protein
MSTVLIVVGILIYAGPCALCYILGRSQGYGDGFEAGKKESRREDDGFHIPDPSLWR